MNEKSIHINTFFLFFSIFFLLGVGVSNIFESLFLCGVCVFIGLLLLCNYRIFTRKHALLLIIMVVAFVGGVGISQNHINQINQKQQFIKLQSHGGIKYITGEVTDIYSVSAFELKYEILLESVKNNETIYYPKDKIYGLVSIPQNFSLKKGDVIGMYEKILPIENFSSDFDYKKYMASQKFFYKINATSINRIDYVQPHIVVDRVDKMRSKLLDKIEELYPEEEGMFLGGILLGARENLPDSLKDNFNKSGLTHFIAVSGFNITILVVFLSYILKFFPTIIKILGITISIGAFTLLVGDAAPVIRASIMGLLAYYILVSGREVHTLSLLLFVAVVMVIWSPFVLTHDVSFHLSFLAVLGILYTQDFFKKVFHFLPETLAIKEAFVLTLAALVFALPVMIFNFGQLSLLSPFANIAVTWTIPIAMLLGFVSIIIDFFSHTLGIWFSYFTWIFLAWDIKVVHFFGGLDWAILKTDFGVYRHALQILYFSVMIFVINYFKISN